MGAQRSGRPRRHGATRGGAVDHGGKARARAHPGAPVDPRERDNAGVNVRTGPPAPPGLTDDGRGGARGVELLPSEAAASPRAAGRRVGRRTPTDGGIPDEAVDEPSFRSPTGSVAGAARRRDRSGVGRSTGRARGRSTRPRRRGHRGVAARRGRGPGRGRDRRADQRSILLVDAAWIARARGRARTARRLSTFFPDPWPKTQHHKRRLVDPGFARLAAARLRPGAEWRLATDWADYAEQMRRGFSTPSRCSRVGSGGAVDRATGHQVRAQGPRRRPRHHRSRVRAVLTGGAVVRRQAARSAGSPAPVASPRRSGRRAPGPPRPGPARAPAGRSWSGRSSSPSRGRRCRSRRRHPAPAGPARRRHAARRWPSRPRPRRSRSGRRPSRAAPAQRAGRRRP